jgi:hypothetical protein
MLCQLLSSYERLRQVRPVSFSLVQVRPDYVRLGQVRSVKVGLESLLNVTSGCVRFVKVIYC